MRHHHLLQGRPLAAVGPQRPCRHLRHGRQEGLKLRVEAVRQQQGAVTPGLQAQGGPRRAVLAYAATSIERVITLELAKNLPEVSQCSEKAPAK